MWSDGELDNNLVLSGLKSLEQLTSSSSSVHKPGALVAVYEMLLQSLVDDHEMDRRGEQSRLEQYARRAPRTMQKLNSITPPPSMDGLSEFLSDHRQNPDVYAICLITLFYGYRHTLGQGRLRNVAFLSAGTFYLAAA